VEESPLVEIVQEGVSDAGGLGSPALIWEISGDVKGLTS